MSGATFGINFVEGLRTAHGIVRDSKLDEEDKRRYDERMDYARDRDILEQNRYDDHEAYQKQRDRVGDERYTHEFGLRETLLKRQMRNTDQQHEQQGYVFARQKENDNRTDQLRKVQGYISLLENGDDGGLVAQSLNDNPEYQKWLTGSGLNNAKFNSLKFNNTGKGQPGVVTVLEGQDKKTGEKRLGVSTANRSSDPDDPVDVMPMPVLAQMIDAEADQLEAGGDMENASRLREGILKHLRGYEASLGGQQKKKWGAVGYQEGIGFSQTDPEGQVHQLDPLKDPSARGYRGLGGSKSGGGGGANARQAQLYRQLGDVLPDDDVKGVDNSLIRDLTVSLAQDIDLQIGGELAPGIYGQVAKESASGLALSRSDAFEKAAGELNEGTVFSAYDQGDEEVQARAEQILEQSKQEFSQRFTSNIGQMYQQRTGFGGMRGQTEPAAQPTPQMQGVPSLDDAVKKMMTMAEGKGKKVSADEARAYLLKQYPDRFGEEVSVEEEVAGNDDEGKPGAIARFFDSEGMNRDIVEPVKRGVKSLVSKYSIPGETAEARRFFDYAEKNGDQPSEGDLAKWLPHLTPEQQSKALDMMTKLYPDSSLTKKAIQEYNSVASN